jgi:hypothetical protein
MSASDLTTDSDHIRQLVNCPFLTTPFTNTSIWRMPNLVVAPVGLPPFHRHPDVPGRVSRARLQESEDRRQMQRLDEQCGADQVHLVVQRRVAFRAQDDGIQIWIGQPSKMNQMQTIERGETQRGDEDVRLVDRERMLGVVEAGRLDDAVSGALERIAESPQVRESRIDQQNRRPTAPSRSHTRFFLRDQIRQ